MASDFAPVDSMLAPLLVLDRHAITAGGGDLAGADECAGGKRHVMPGFDIVRPEITAGTAICQQGKQVTEIAEFRPLILLIRFTRNA